MNSGTSGLGGAAGTAVGALPAAALDAGMQVRAGSGGMQPTAGTGTLGTLDPPDASVAEPTVPEPFLLLPVADSAGDGAYAFPATALPPTNQSPEFRWQGVPRTAKSLALVFRDLDNQAVKWILWDIPPDVTHVPSNVSDDANPAEVPGSSQLGSLNNQGYAGPCCEDRRYEFVLWALDVEELPGTARLTTARIWSEVLPDHDIVTSEPIIMRIMR